MVAAVVGAWYLAIFILVAIGEFAFVARRVPGSDARLIANFGLGMLNMALLAVIPVGIVTVAAYGENHHLGLLNRVAIPPAAGFGISFLCLTLAQYAVHRLFHAVPLFWRIHRVHHADRFIDASTTLRNHPLEQLLVLGVTCPLVLLLGLPVWAVTAIEVATFAVAVLSHANLSLPRSWSRHLARVFVTPAFHLVHHSADQADHDANYGDLITLWDALFGSYRDRASIARLGLGDASDATADSLVAQLRSPFGSAQSTAPPTGRGGVA